MWDVGVDIQLQRSDKALSSSLLLWSHADQKSLYESIVTSRRPHPLTQHLSLLHTASLSSCLFHRIITIRETSQHTRPRRPFHYLSVAPGFYSSFLTGGGQHPPPAWAVMAVAVGGTSPELRHLTETSSSSVISWSESRVYLSASKLPRTPSFFLSQASDASDTNPQFWRKRTPTTWS